jgi:uncharacterized protein (TIGR02453 family)
MSFNGFPKGTVTFLRQLEKNNNRKWFEDHRADYERKLVEPAKEFVIELGRRLDRFDRGIETEPRIDGSIRRINRDTRFSKDKTPYKNHLDFYFPHRDFRGRPGYWLRITPKTVGVGAGLHGFDNNLVKKWRDAVVENDTGVPLADVLRRLTKTGYTAYGEHYKRVPAGFDPDHPRAHLLRYKSLHVGADLKHPPELHTAEFVNYVMGHIRRLSPIANWLVALVDD